MFTVALCKMGNNVELFLRFLGFTVDIQIKW